MVMDSSNCSSSMKSQEFVQSEDTVSLKDADEIPSATNKIDNHSDISSGNLDIHFDCLPHVVILTILSYLNLKDLGRTARVSKHLNACCSYPGLWSRVDVSNRRQVNDAVLLRIIDISKNISMLDISETVNISEYGLRAALQGCRTLQQFKAVRCYNVSDACLEVVGRKCVDLRVIDLSMCKITDEGIGQLCQGCTKLEQIKLNHCIQLTSHTLKHIANNCHKLKFLSVENNAKMHDDGVEELVSKCSQLRRLQLNSCGITGHSIQSIAMYSHAMSVLDVRYCTTVNDDMVQKLVYGCTNLVILNLSLCFKVTDVSVVHICRYCTRLKSIYLVHCGITDQGLKTMSSSTLGLQWIDVSWCQEITDGGVRALLQGCTTLEHLGIVRCDLVSNETIHDLCSRYPSVYISSFITEMDRFFKKAGNNSEANLNQSVPQ